MIALDATNEHPTTSLGRFFASHAKQYRELANAPVDVTNSDKRALIELETLEMHDEHKRGATLSALAKKYGINSGTVSQRFKRRGLRVYYHAGGIRV